MIRRVFVDADVILDVAVNRKPFADAGKAVLALLENYTAAGFISSNSVGNMYYILRKAGGEQKTRRFLSGLLTFITVIPLHHADVLEALDSDFSDFEDALQHAAASKSRCDCIITRNTEDYVHSKLSVYLPLEFLHLFQ